MVQFLHIDNQRLQDMSQSADPSCVFSASWEADTATTYCRGCKQPFSTLTRRHHCRACGRLFCNNCTRFREVVDGNPARVCTECYQSIHAKRLESNSSSSSSSAQSHASSDGDKGASVVVKREEERHTLSFQVGSTVADSVPMDHLGMFELERPSESKEFSPLIYEVSRYKGGFLMDVHSNMFVRNDLQVPVSLRAIDPDFEAPWVCSLEPGARVFMPIEYTSQAFIFFCPLPGPRAAAAPQRAARRDDAAVPVGAPVRRALCLCVLGVHRGRDERRPHQQHQQ